MDYDISSLVLYIYVHRHAHIYTNCHLGIKEGGKKHYSFFFFSLKPWVTIIVTQDEGKIDGMNIYIESIMSNLKCQYFPGLFKLGKT